MAWTQITSAQCDADSPIDETLMQLIRTNFDHIFDGTDISTDLVTQDSIAAAAVGIGELVFGTASSTIACGGVATVVQIGVSYGHSVQMAWTRSSGTSATYRSGYTKVDTTNKSSNYIGTEGDGSSPVPTGYTYTVYYHNNCAPYAPFLAGGKNCGEWGLFCHLLRDKSDGQIFAGWCAPDPFWAMEGGANRPGGSMWEKNDPELIAANPFPYMAVDLDALASEKPGAELEHVLIDTREWALNDTQFDPHMMRAEELERRAALMDSGPEKDALVSRSMESMHKSRPRTMRNRDALAYRGSALGQAPWEILVKEFPQILTATAAATENGHPIKTGVPAFDDRIPILRP